MQSENLERILLTELLAAHLAMGGDVQVKDFLWTPSQSFDREAVYSGFTCVRKDKVEGQWDGAEAASAAADSVIAACQHNRIKWDEIIFYPKDDDRTGVPWRMLKLDMPYLRIVLMRDDQTLLAITKRLASIVSKALSDGLGMQPPKPDRN